MKFIVQLIANFLRAVLTSCQKLLSQHKLNSVDLCVFCTTVFLAAGYYYPWCLIVAFVCMLPPLQQQLYLPDDQREGSAGSGGMGGEGGQKRELTLEEELQAQLQHEEQALARELAGGGGGGEGGSSSSSSSKPLSEDEQEQEQGGEQRQRPPASSPEGRKREKAEKREKKEKEKEKEREKRAAAGKTGDKAGAAEKPRVGKALWGLPTLRVRDSNGVIVEINSDKPVPIETDYFKGTILIMCRTEGDLEQYNRYEHHFSGKQRKFEVQFQGNMKNVPTGEVMLGGELQDKMDISFVTRALLSMFTKFFMALNPFLHFGFGETPKNNDMHELPHLTFPLFRVMDRVIVTAPGGQLPELGKELKEDEGQRKERRAGRGVVSFKQGHTYSFSFHSMYVDFSRWAICNFPGYKAIDISGFFGMQHINVVVYEITEKDLMATGKAQHYNAHKRYLLTLELKHESCMSPEELEQAEREDEEEFERKVAGGADSESEDSDGDEDSEEEDREEDSEEEDCSEETTSDGEQLHSGDDMDEESLAIAREMAGDQRDFQLEQQHDHGAAGGGLLHEPDDSELIPGGAVVALIAIPAPWEPWDQEKSEEKDAEEGGGGGRGGRSRDRARREMDDMEIDIDPRDGLSALRPPLSRDEGSRIMHGNAMTHEDCGLSPKRTCFGVADVGGVAVRKECSSLPAVRFLPVTPPHISTSRLARLSLRRSGHNTTTASPPARRKSMLSALYPRRRNTSHAEKHSTITPQTTAATDQAKEGSLSPVGLRCGDAIQLQSVSSGRYLTVHKGWWLGWTSEDYQPSASSKHNRNAAKVLFTLHPTDSTGLKYMPQGTPLVAGMPFRLRSVRWPDWEVGCCEPTSRSNPRESPVVLYYAKIKVRHQVPTSGPVKWHNSSKKVNPLCLSVMHEDSGGGGGVGMAAGSGGGSGRRRSLSSSEVVSSHGATGFESHPISIGGGISGPKRLFGVSPTRIVNMTPHVTITGIGGGLKEENTTTSSSGAKVSTGSILTPFLGPLDVSKVTEEDRSELSVTVSGWVEVLNRSLNFSQLAYVITVSYKSDSEGTQTKWTTLRTQEDLEEIFTQIEQEQEQQQEQQQLEQKQGVQRSSIHEEEGGEEQQQPAGSSLSPADRNSINSVSDGEMGGGGYVSSSSDAKGWVSGGGSGGGARDQWSLMDRDEEERLASSRERERELEGGGEREGGQKRQQLLQQRGSGGAGGSKSDSGGGGGVGTTPSRLQRAKRSVLRRSRVNIQRHDIAPNHLYPADQNVLIMTNRILKALSSKREASPAGGGAGGAGALSSPSSQPSAFDSTDSLLSYEEQHGKKVSSPSNPNPTPPVLVRRTSLDDGSGTRKQDRSSAEEGAGASSKTKHQSMSLGSREQLAALQGYLSDSSVPSSHSPQRPNMTAESSLSLAPPSADKDKDKDKDEVKASEAAVTPTTTIAHSAHIAKRAFLAALSAPQILDTWFLSEDSDKYLRAPPPPKPKKGAPPFQPQVTIVARALWDSHWREEIAVVFPAYIAFYPLLAKKASWTLHLQELIGISHLDDATSPLPGFSILRIETIGRLHYLAFASKESCNVLAASVLEHFSEITFDSSRALASPAGGGDVGDPRDRFVLKSGRWRPAGRRLILNARKFLFDVEDKTSSSLLPKGSGSGSGDGSTGGDKQQQHGASGPHVAVMAGGVAKLDFSALGPEPYWRFAERLLQDVFRLELTGGGSTSDAEGLFPGREMIIKFLDETVKLKQINLQRDVNFSSPEALCFFTNIYHTLLMHARLVLGPPNSQDWASFFDTVCYEIGSDVFSLCEIEHCVLGGRLARPQAAPRSFAAVPRANDDHYLYALPADRRMRFLVNYGSLSLLPTLYLMTPETMHHSLNEASVAFFESSMVVDMKKRTVTLPKICDTFGLDFGEDALGVLRHILRYLNRDNWEKVSILLSSGGGKAPSVKFQDLKPRSHTRLHLVIQK